MRRIQTFHVGNINALSRAGGASVTAGDILRGSARVPSAVRGHPEDSGRNAAREVSGEHISQLLLSYVAITYCIY